MKHFKLSELKTSHTALKTPQTQTYITATNVTHTAVTVTHITGEYSPQAEKCTHNPWNSPTCSEKYTWWPVHIALIIYLSGRWAPPKGSTFLPPFINPLGNRRPNHFGSAFLPQGLLANQWNSKRQTLKLKVWVTGTNQFGAKVTPFCWPILLNKPSCDFCSIPPFLKGHSLIHFWLAQSYYFGTVEKPNLDNYFVRKDYFSIMANYSLMRRDLRSAEY